MEYGTIRILYYIDRIYVPIPRDCVRNKKLIDISAAAARRQEKY